MTRKLDDEPAAGQLALRSSRGRWLVATMVLGSAVGQLEGTVVNVALPTIGRDLNASVASLQWTLNGYLLTLAALILLGGSLGDRFGRRRIFLIGVVWFTVASAVCALAPSMSLLVAARILQGVGGALLTPGSLAILEAVLRPGDRAAAIGAWSGLGGIAAAVGPLVGGWLVDAVSWRWVFLINLPLGVVVVVLALRYVPETRDEQAPAGFDVPGAVLITAGLAGVTYALVAAGQSGFDPLVIAAAVAGLAALTGFVAVERRSRHPLLPLGIFTSRRFTAANLITLIVYAALGGVLFLLVIVLQNALGYSALEAGAASLPITALMLALSARAGVLAQRIGARIPLTVGPLLIAAGMLLMLRIAPGSSYVASVLPAMIVFGLGLAATVSPVTSTVLAAAPDRYAGAASGVNNATARTGQLLAVAVLPLVAGITGGTLTDPVALTGAFHTAMVITAALAASGGLLAFFTLADVTPPTTTRPAVPAEATARPTVNCGVDAPPSRPVVADAGSGGGTRP